MSLISQFKAATLIALTVMTLSAPAQDPARRSTVVRASGIGIPSPEKSDLDLHREAVSDALKNAVRQSCSQVDMDLELENMMIKQKQLRIETSGRADLVNIISSGMTTNSSVAFYQVQLDALVVKPEPSSPPLTPPSITLSVSHSENNLLADQIEHEIRRELQILNIATTPSSEASPSIMITCRLDRINDSSILLAWDLTQNSQKTKSRQQYQMSKVTGHRIIRTNDAQNDFKSLAILIAAETDRIMH